MNKLTAEQKETIATNRSIIDLVINHNYRVQKSNDEVKKILAIAVDLGGELCKTCPHMIQDAYRLVWMEYKKQISTPTAKQPKKTYPKDERLEE
jgi:hypothetical protein